MPAACPYCENKDTKLYYSAELPFHAWPLSRGENNFTVPVKIFLCPNCWYAFNHKPLPEEFIKRFYDHYGCVHTPEETDNSPNGEFFLNLVINNAGKKDRIIEAGHSNKYLLTKLFHCGYKNLMEIDFNMNLSIPVIDEDQIQETVYGAVAKAGSNVILFDHVFEHLERPWEFLKMISNKLGRGGKILMEFPGYCNGMHHQHVSFFTLPFLRTMSDEVGLTMKVVFHDSLTVTRVIFKKDGLHKKPHPSPAELEEEIKEITLNTQKVMEGCDDKRSKLNDFLKNARGEDIYWWDTGMHSAILYNYAEPHFKNNLSFKFIDSDDSREGKIFFPAGAPVFAAEKTLRDTNIKYLVLASQFKDEMTQKLQEWNCNAEKIFHFTLNNKFVRKKSKNVQRPRLLLQDTWA